MKRVLAAIAVVSSIAWAGPLAAAPPPKEADAERLFREGQKLMEDRRFAEACPKLEASFRKDRQLGTLLNLAYCHKEQGAAWLAWLEFRDAELLAGELARPERRDFARQRMAEIEAKSLARAVVDLPHDPSPKVVLTEVVVEDRAMAEAEKGHPFAVEPGPRKVTFRARGKKDVAVVVTFARGEQPQHVAVPAMDDDVPDEPAPPVAVASPPAPTPPPELAPADRGSAQRTAGLVLAGAGVAGIAAGSVAGVMTLANGCSNGGARPRCSEAEKDRGDTTATISNVGFIAGGAALVAGVVIYLLAPRGIRAHADIGMSKAASSAGLGGVF